MAKQAKRKTPAARSTKSKRAPSAPSKKKSKSKRTSASSSPKPIVGSIAWRDLTVKNADAVRDFYCAVVGWKVMPIEMGGYSDYCMIPPASETPEAGVCHKRGMNSDIPSQWLMYVVVADLDSSLEQCKRRGGKQITQVRPQGSSRFAVIADPSGAMIGLYEVG